MQLTSSPAEVLAWAEQDGVDLSMLRERLWLTPTERFQRHQAALALIEALHHAQRTLSHAPGRAIADRLMQG